MSKDDSYEGWNSLHKVTYYNFNGLVEYNINNLVSRTQINIPFEYFDHWMKVLLTIKKKKDANLIVNGDKETIHAICFFDELKEIGEKYFLKLYNAVWKNVPVSRYEFRLPKIIDEFHGDILESIKLYSKRLEREE